MGSVCSRRHRSEKVSCFPISSSEPAGGPEGGETVQVVRLHTVSPEHAFLPRLSKAVTSCIMALVCAINLYFVISYLPSLPHPAYFSLVALLAIGYLGLTAYLVLGSAKGQGGRAGEGDMGLLRGLSSTHGPFPGLDLLHRPWSQLSDA